MSTIIMSHTWPKKLDGSVKAKTMTFLQKLQEDDTSPGLHVEPIAKCADDRVRTGRVDQFWRAVMFRLDSGGERHYVIHGVWPHDDAIEVARKTTLTVNPVNGLPQFSEAGVPEQVVYAPGGVPSDSTPFKPFLADAGYAKVDLVETLGLPTDVADAALAAADDAALLALSERYEGWINLILLGLAAGDGISTIVASLGLQQTASTDSDAEILTSLQRPAALSQFTFIEDQDELRRVIDGGDFKAWRVFLHPEQRRFVDVSTSGPMRISGGAGTGKTVVLIHRARRLAAASPEARVVLTTFTTNLAESLQENLVELDPTLKLARHAGEPGVRAVGVDALASAVLKQATASELALATAAVLGEERSSANTRTGAGRWRQVLDDVKTSLPDEVANETFLASEYSVVVLPNRVQSGADYERVRRPGRGLALDRGRRREVWRLIEAYRAIGRADGSLDFAEAAAVAAAHLEGQGGQAPRKLADHVLVDEGQDLLPAHWQMLRAIVGEGTDDLFIAEDSHQRIYGNRIVLGRYGIKIVGRSRRLTLNYRTTAENLAYAMSMLEGGDYRDLEDEPDATGYRSARSGPQPTVVNAKDLSEELRLVRDQVKAWLDDEVDAGTVAVLVPDRFQRDRLAKSLNDAKVPAVAVDRERPPGDRVQVMTMHRAKGVEFSRVVITDVGHVSLSEKERLQAMDESERADGELRKRSLVYVAATRARDELMVIGR